MNYDPTEPTEPGEFTALCNCYYELKQLSSKRLERLKVLTDNAPMYDGETNLAEIDTIISYYRKTQAYKLKMDRTFAELNDVKRNIKSIMDHFGIPANTILTGQIPDELEYEIWLDNDDTLFIMHIEDLAPTEHGCHIITVKLIGADGPSKDDDE